VCNYKKLQLSGDTFVVASGFTTGKDIVDLAFEMREIPDKDCKFVTI